MSTEIKSDNKILDVEGNRIKKEITPKLYDELMANLNQEQQMQILRGIQSYLNQSNKLDKSSKLTILSTLTPKENETPKAYVDRMNAFFSDPKLKGGRKKKKRKTQKKRKQRKRHKTYKKRKSSRTRKKKSRSRRRR